MKHLKGIKWNKITFSEVNKKNQEYMCLIHGNINLFAKAYKYSWLAK